MQHSLTNRFRGAFLGAIIGEILGVNTQHPIAPWRMVEQWGLQCPPHQSSSGQFMVQQATALIQGSSLPIASPPIANLPIVSKPIANTPIASTSIANIPIANIPIANTPIAHLPLMLFYHENLALLQSQLAKQLPETELASCLKVGKAIAAALCEQSPIHSFPHSSDFRLCLLHLAQTHPELCAIAGAQVGAEQSFTGIPPSWRQRLGKVGYAAFWGLTSEAEMLQLADHLLAAWLGVYHPTQALMMPVAAAPHIIRPR